MKISNKTKPRGIALFIVMIAIFVLSVMAAIFAASMKVEIKLAANAEHEEQLLWLGRSGVEYCRWILSQESCPYDALNQVWAGGTGSACDTNLASFVQNPYPLGDCSFTWSITNLESKLNINTANPILLQRALNNMGVDVNSISVVSDSILDWISPGENTRLAGAKSDYYQNLDPPYYCKDTPMDDPSELLLIRGIWDHPEIYTGGCSTNQEPAAFQPRLGLGNSPFQTPCYSFGLSNIVTAISNGRININTADTNVLQLLPGVDDAIAENIVKMRAGPDGMDGTEDDTPFSNPSQITMAGAPAADANYCTVRGSAFEVHVIAQIPNVPERNYYAVLYRNSPTDIKVLSFYWK